MLVATNEDLRVAMYECVFGDEDSKAAGLTALPVAAGKFLAGIERALQRKGSEGPFFLEATHHRWRTLLYLTMSAHLFPACER
jgi:hypothetical protein